MVHKQYCGFKVTQRNNPEAVEFFVFAAHPRDIVQWSVVEPAAEHKGGVHRRISQARVRALTNFFTKNSRNVIPTSIVLAFPPEITTFTKIECNNASTEHCQLDESIQWGVLSFEFDPDAPSAQRPALIVDGHHRLCSMAEVPNEHIPVLVSAILNAEPDEQAFQCIVINNKVTRVPTDLVRSLIADFSADAALQKRLETARVSLHPQALLIAIVDDEPESPLYQMVNWERRRGEGIAAVKPAAIEDSLKYIRRRFLEFDEDHDALIDFFFAMWQGVKEAYPELWTDKTDNRLFENAGFKSFSEYLCDQIEVLSSMGIDFVDIEDKESISSASHRIALQIDIRFWLESWQFKSLDSSTGREIIKEDIQTIRTNRREHRYWSDGVKLVGIQEEVAVLAERSRAIA